MCPQLMHPVKVKLVHLLAISDSEEGERRTSH
jgi:hypothetical protein